MTRARSIAISLFIVSYLQNLFPFGQFLQTNAAEDAVTIALRPPRLYRSLTGQNGFYSGNATFIRGFSTVITLYSIKIHFSSILAKPPKLRHSIHFHRAEADLFRRFLVILPTSQRIVSLTEVHSLISYSSEKHLYTSRTICAP